MRYLPASWLLGLATMAVASFVQAQQPAPPAAQPSGASTVCDTQYHDAPGITPAQLLGRGFDIKAGWPGGLWLQKDKEAFFCNSGRTLEGSVICWTLGALVKSATCQ